MSNPIDLKLLVQLINDQKDIETNLILDKGCIIEAEDQAPLVKVINYFMNYLHNLSKGPIQISLDLMGDSCLMSFITYTDVDSIPEFSSNLSDARIRFDVNNASIFRESKRYINGDIGEGKGRVKVRTNDGAITLSSSN